MSSDHNLNVHLLQIQRDAYKILVGKPDVGVDEKIILKKQDVAV
jgi:hypothetical protein